MARGWNDLLNEGRRRNWHVPDPIPYSRQSMVKALCEGLGLGGNHTPKTKLRAIVDGSFEFANEHGLTFDEVLFIWLRQENLLFAAGRAEVSARRR